MAWSDAARAAALATRRAHRKHVATATKLARIGKLDRVYAGSGLKYYNRGQLGRALRSARSGGHYYQKKYFGKAVKQAAYARVYAKATGIKKSRSAITGVNFTKY